MAFRPRIASPALVHKLPASLSPHPPRFSGPLLSSYSPSRLSSSLHSLLDSFPSSPLWIPPAPETLPDMAENTNPGEVRYPDTMGSGEVCFCRHPVRDVLRLSQWLSIVLCSSTRYLQAKETASLIACRPCCEQHQVRGLAHRRRVSQLEKHHAPFDNHRHRSTTDPYAANLC